MSDVEPVAYRASTVVVGAGELAAMGPTPSHAAAALRALVSNVAPAVEWHTTIVEMEQLPLA